MSSLVIPSVFEREPGHIFTETATPPNYPEGSLKGVIGVAGFSNWGPLELTRVNTSDEWKARFGSSGSKPTEKQIEYVYANGTVAGIGAPLFFKRVVHYTNAADLATITALKSSGVLYDGTPSAATIGTPVAGGSNAGDDTVAESGTYVGTGNGSYRVEVTTAGAFGVAEVTTYFTPTGGVEVAIGTATPADTAAFVIENGVSLAITDGGDTVLTLADEWTIAVVAEGKASGDERIDVAAKYYGSLGNDISVVTSAGSEGTAGEFKLVVNLSGTVKESYDNLSVDSTAERYFVTIINSQSSYIVVADTVNIQDVALGQTVTLEGASDGDAVVLADYTGSPISATGFHGFNETILPMRVACFDADVEAASNTYYNALDTFIKAYDTRLFGFYTAPKTAVTETLLTTWRSGSFAVDSEFGMSFAGWLTDEVTGLVVSPVGAMLGLSSRLSRDTQYGTDKAFAGEELTLVGFSAVNINFTKTTNGILNEVGLNVIKQQAGVGIFCNGARTLTKTKKRNYKYAPQVLLVQEIEHLIHINTYWIKFKNLSSGLYTLTHTQVSSILSGYDRAGALNSEDGSPYAVICNNGLQTAEMKNAGIILCKWGIRTRFVAEFVWFSFTNLTSGAEL